MTSSIAVVITWSVCGPTAKTNASSCRTTTSTAKRANATETIRSLLRRVFRYAEIESREEQEGEQAHRSVQELLRL